MDLDAEREREREIKMKYLIEGEKTFQSYMRKPIKSLSCEEKIGQLRMAIMDIRERIGVISEESSINLNKVNFGQFINRLDNLANSLECNAIEARKPTVPIPVTPVPPSPLGIMDLIPQLTKTVIKSLIGNIDNK